MNPVTGATWGGMSKVQVLVEPPPVGRPAQVPIFGSTDANGDYDWTTFDQNSTAFKNGGRANAFHHVILVHQHNVAGNGGISRNDPAFFSQGASDFLISPWARPRA